MNGNDIFQRVGICAQNRPDNIEAAALIVGEDIQSLSCGLKSEVTNHIVYDAVQNQSRRILITHIGNGEGVGNIVTDLGERGTGLEYLYQRLEEIDRS